MTTNNQMATVQIAIQETTLLALLALRQSNEESIAGVVGRLAHSQNYAHDDEEAEQAVLAVAVVEKRHKYEVTFLGQILGSDALGDMLYILCGTIIEHGMQHKIEEVFEEIQRSNMSKLGEDGEPIYREDGKVLKGPNYFKPNIKEILDK